MGVDIGTYRCRIGTFRQGPGIDVVLLKLCVNYVSGIKTIGAVAFIGLLLIMAGVEMNPGPTGTPKDMPVIETVLKSVGLEKYIDIFLENEIGITEVIDMTREDFQFIGITAIGVRIKLVNACKQFIKDGTPQKEEIKAMSRELDDYGIQMPTFDTKTDGNILDTKKQYDQVDNDEYFEEITQPELQGNLTNVTRNRTYIDDSQFRLESDDEYYEQSDNTTDKDSNQDMEDSPKLTLPAGRQTKYSTNEDNMDRKRLSPENETTMSIPIDNENNFEQKSFSTKKEFWTEQSKQRGNIGIQNKKYTVAVSHTSTKKAPRNFISPARRQTKLSTDENNMDQIRLTPRKDNSMSFPIDNEKKFGKTSMTSTKKRIPEKSKQSDDIVIPTLKHTIAASHIFQKQASRKEKKSENNMGALKDHHVALTDQCNTEGLHSPKLTLPAGRQTKYSTNEDNMDRKRLSPENETTMSIPIDNENNFEQKSFSTKKEFWTEQSKQRGNIGIQNKKYTVAASHTSTKKAPRNFVSQFRFGEGSVVSDDITNEDSDYTNGEYSNKDIEEQSSTDIDSQSRSGEGSFGSDDETDEQGDTTTDEDSNQETKGFTRNKSDRKSDLDNMLKRFELQKWFPSKISLQDITAIDLHQQRSKGTIACLPWYFLKQIAMAKTTARDHSIYEYFNTDNESDDVDDDSEFDICPIDMFITVFYCCDPMLKQFVCGKLFMCRQALPFMIGDPFKINSSLLSLWPLRPIVVEWKNSKQVSTESFILDQPTKIVAFTRFGRPSFSKSKLQNDMLSCNKHDTFYNKDSPYGESERLLCQNYIEASWFLPGGTKNDMFDEFLTFLNVRGDLSNNINDAQKKFISFSSAVTVIIVDMFTLKKQAQCIENFLNTRGNHILIISLNTNDKNYENRILKLIEAYTKCSGKDLPVIYTQHKGRARNATEMEKAIRRELKKILKCVEPVQLGELWKDASQMCIKSDEEEKECKAGKMLAEDLFSKIKNSGPQEQWKETITPLQHKYWVELSKKNKQLQRSLDEYGHVEKIKNEMKNIKERQSKKISDPVKYFIRIIVSQIDEGNTNTLIYFIEWLKIFMDGISRALLPNLRNKYNQEWQTLNDMKQKKRLGKIGTQTELVQSLEKSIADASFGVEHLFREIGQIFESAKLSKHVTGLPSPDKISKAVAHIMSNGYPFELLDGDASNIPTDWVKSVLTAFQDIIGSKKFLILSVLGIQSSGKSTLLNTMFGLKFAVSAGRCTRGVYLQMVRVFKTRDVPFDYVMVIDSEGLRAPELKDIRKDRDNELATFVIGLGDFTLLNIKGENTAEMNDILEITIHAFLRLKAVNNKLDLRQKCIFVHQNVPAINAEEKMKYGMQKLVENLDSMTKEAAQSENLENITTFNQVIEFNGSKHVWYIPDLWQGDPPMAAINKGYSEKVEDLRSSIIEMALVEKQKSYKCLPDIIVHANELWKGILSEDFVFSFRNSLEIKAYLQMEKKYKEIAWKLECFVRIGIQSDIRNGLNSCSTGSKVEALSDDLFSKLKVKFIQKAIEAKAEMEHFFEKSDYVEIVINWKDNRLNILEELTEFLVKNLRKEINKLSRERKLQIMTSSTNEKNIEQLHKESIQLAKQIKGNSFSQKEKDDRFDKIWQRFVESLEWESESDAKSIRQMFMDSLMDEILNNERAILKTTLKSFDNLEKKLGLKKLVGSFYKMQITEEIVFEKQSIVTKFLRKITSKQNIDIVEKQTDTFFCSIDQTVKQHTSKAGEIQQSEVKEILLSILTWFEAHKSDHGFTLTLSFKVRLFVFISCHISGIFESHNSKYREHHGFQAKLKKYRAEVRAIFDDCLETRKAESTASTILGNEIEDFVSKQVNARLPLKTEEKLTAFIPCIKYHLIVEILEDLAEVDNFKDYLQYIQTPEQFAESWISEKCKAILFGENNEYTKLATTEITKLFDEIKFVIADASEKCCSNETINDWIQYFTTGLTNCKMEIERFNSLKRIKVVDFSNFKTDLNENISNIERKIINTFKENDANSVKWTTNPYINLKNRIWGCKHSCIFCGEPCSKTSEHTDKAHTSIQHRPSGVKGTNSKYSKEISLTSCNFDVQSTLTHTCGVFKNACTDNNGECELESHEYKDYRKYITDWDIEPCADMEDTSKYWMWVMASHSEDFKNQYDIVVSNIPDSWNEITKSEAIESIHKLYKS